MLRNIEQAIEGRGLPFPIHVEDHGAKIALTIKVADDTGPRIQRSVLFLRPSDPVLLDGLNPALEKIITMANLAQHMGLVLF